MAIDTVRTWPDVESVSRDQDRIHITASSGTLSSGKATPAFVNLTYLPMMYLGGLFFPLPKSVQPIEFASPALRAGRLTTYGLGQTKPISTNDTPQGRAENRRVEFVKV